MLERSLTSEGFTVSVTDADEYPVVDLFDDLDLQEGLLRGIYSYGFEKPSAIQQRGIRPVLDGRDTIDQAQSGTGKTATFVIGSLQRIDYSLSAYQALTLAPTRADPQGGVGTWRLPQRALPCVHWRNVGA